MIILWIKRGVVWIRLGGDPGESRHPRRVGIGVVKKNLVPHLHVIAHEVSGLIVPHSIPKGRLVAGQVIDRIAFRLGLHQPKAIGGHRLTPVLDGGSQNLQEIGQPAGMGRPSGGSHQVPIPKRLMSLQRNEFAPRERNLWAAGGISGRPSPREDSRRRQKLQSMTDSRDRLAATAK